MSVWFVSLILLIPATVACGYYLIFTTLGWRRQSVTPSEATLRLAIVIPAYNEEANLPSTLRSIAASDIPLSLLNVLVIADNCSDNTAAIAEAHGASCLVRDDDAKRAKGYALELGIPWAIERWNPDAIVILDADCELSDNTLSFISQAVKAGAEAVQVARLPRNSAGPTAMISVVGSILENAVSAGRDRCGLPVALRGSGMAFTTELLQRHPWRCYGLTEDAEYGAILTQAKVRIRFLNETVVRGEVPSDPHTLMQQRRRWRAALRATGPGLLGRWLASKPLVLAQLFVTVIVVSLLTPLLIPWVLALVLATMVVYFRAIRRMENVRLFDLVRTPIGVVRLAGTTIAGLFARTQPWQRTRRLAELE